MHKSDKHASIKLSGESGFRATLNFQLFKVALNLLRKIFLTLLKASFWHADYISDINNWFTFVNEFTFYFSKMRLQALKELLALLSPELESSKMEDRPSCSLKTLLLTVQMLVLSGSLGLQLVGPEARKTSDIVHLLHYQVNFNLF